jgi:hypothetical protein
LNDARLNSSLQDLERKVLIVRAIQFHEVASGLEERQQMHARSSYRFLFVVLLLIVTATSGFAQYRASLQGTVTDPSGASIPGATVTVKSTETNFTRSAQTSDTGVYSIPSLAPGLYTITVDKQGFRKNEISNFRIVADQSQGANFQLKIGETSQSVTVSAEAVPPINTENAQISGTVSAREIQRLPSFGRDVFQLAQLAPGVVGDASRDAGGGTQAQPGNAGPGGSGGSSGVFNTENRAQVSVNGGRTNANGVNLDGISISSVTWGGAAIVTPNEDSVKEVRIVSNQYDAEFGRFAGGQIQVISQNGTNNFHGSAFFKADRPGLNAKQRWVGAENNPRTPVKNTNRFNDWGGSIGAPIVKNRLFGFFSYETIRNSSNSVESHWYETPQFLDVAKTSGATNAKLYGGYPGMAIVPTSIQNQTCASIGLVEGTTCHLVSDQGLDILNGSAVGLDGIPDIMFANVAGPNNSINEQFNGRVDFQATSKDLIAFSMYRVPVSQTFPNGFRPANQFHHDATNEAETILWNRTFTPTFLNELRANAAGWRWNELTSNPQIALGLPQPLYIGDPNNGNKIGNISINDNPLGGPAGSVFSQWTYSIKDTATKVQGSHTIKFGGDATSLHYLQEAPWSARPQFGFNSLFDFLQDNATKESGTFNPQTGVPTDVRKDARQTLLGFFGQDDWKVRQNLTVNLGLRWEYFSPMTFLRDQLATVVLGQGNAALTGMSIRKGGDLYNADKHNFAPQIGFAWSPGTIKGHAFNNKLVIRGGAGIGYTGEQMAITANGWGNIPFTNNGTSLTGSQIVYAIPSDPNQFQPFPANPNTIGTFDANNIPTSGSPVGVTAFPADFHTAMTYRYSLDTQYEFLPNWVASVGYQGSISRHLTRQYNLNQVLGAKGVPLNPFINNVDYYNPDGKAHSNALIVTLNHNFSREFQFNAQYRFSKSMDNESGPYSISPYQWNEHADWGLSDFDVRHLWKFYGIYSPTFFHGDRSWMEKILGGWSLSGILNWHTGYPFTPFSGSSCDIVYAKGNCQPGATTNLMPVQYNGNAGTDYSNSAFLQQGGNFQQGPLAYFTPAKFTPCALPFPQTCITLPQAPGIMRNAFRGPRYMDVDATLSKSFGFPKLPLLGEGTRFEFRANAFNLFNNQNLTGIDAFMGSWKDNTQTVFNANPNFGTALNALGGRTVELQARFSF